MCETDNKLVARLVRARNIVSASIAVNDCDPDALKLGSPRCVPDAVTDLSCTGWKDADKKVSKLLLLTDLLLRRTRHQGGHNEVSAGGRKVENNVCC